MKRGITGTGKPVLLGKRPAKYDARNLRLAKYLVAPKLVAPPASTDHYAKVSDWMMYANDRYGDCTIAAAGHAIESWSTYAAKGPGVMTDQEILAAYWKVSGGVGQDNGAYMLDVMNLWRKEGIGPDKIEAFVQIDHKDLTQLKLAINLFGSAYFGMALPDVNTFGPWIEVQGPPDYWNGHAISIVGYNDTTGRFKVATWGELVDMSYAWALKYGDEAYASLNDLSIRADSGQSPEGFDFVTLQEDLSHIGDPVTPEPAPPPEPAPEPDFPPSVVVRYPIFTQITQPGVRLVVNGNPRPVVHRYQFEAAEEAGAIFASDPNADITAENVGSFKVGLE